MKTIIKLLVLFILVSPCYGKTKIVKETPVKKTKQKVKKIINGQSANLSSQALLSNTPKILSSGNHAGGIIIADRWILTAGHVIDTGFNVYVGINNRNDANTPIPIKAKIRNSGYNPSSLKDDIGLVYLDIPIISNSSVTAIKLASEQNNSDWAVGNNLNVYGFGRTTAGGGGDVSQTLLFAPVNIISSSDNSKIFAQGIGTNDACQGDSGGPLIKESPKLLAGIVSSDLSGTSNNGGCGTGGRYSKVSQYLDFIVRTMHEYGTPDFVCEGTETVFDNLPMMPDGCSMTWTAQADPGYPSNLFTQTSGTGLSFSTAAQQNAQGFGVISLVFTYPIDNLSNTNSKTFFKRVWVGRPTAINLTTDGTFNITGNNASICRTFGYCMAANNTTIAPFAPPAPQISAKSVTAYSWQGWPDANSFFDMTTSAVPYDRVCFGTNNTGTYMVNLTAQNSCGTNNRMLFITVNSCGMRVFPNPAKNVVKVEFEAPDKLESIPNLIEIYDEKQQKKSKSIDLSKDKGEKIEIDVSDLPRGIYYMKLNFAKKSEIETIRLILE